MASRQSLTTKVLNELSTTGLILQSDPLLPSVAGIVSGEKIAGSWWGHPKGHEIFSVLKRLDSDPDALLTRLISGKVTYLHRRLWPEFLRVATSSEEWQTKDLSGAGRRLFRLVSKKGTIRMDQLARGNTQDLSRAAKEIEGRLLVYSDEVHTETGAHAKVLMRWSACPKLRGFHPRPVDPEASRASLSKILARLNGQYGAHGTLPWEDGTR